MLAEKEIQSLLTHPNPQVSEQAAVVLKLLRLVKLNREQLQTLLSKETK